MANAQEKKRRRRGAFGSEEATTRVLVQVAVVGGTVAVAVATRPLSWLGPVLCWHTSVHKRSPFFHRRAPASNTANPEGLPDGSVADAGRQGIRKPFTAGGTTTDRENAQGALRGGHDLLAPHETGRAHCYRRFGVLGVPLESAGRRSRWRRVASMTTGSVPVRTFSGRSGACVVLRACLWPPQRAACPCRRGIAHMTRRCRSCHCAGVCWRRTAGMVAPGGS